MLPRQRDIVFAEPRIVFRHRHQAFVLITMELEAIVVARVAGDPPALAVERQADLVQFQPYLVAGVGRDSLDPTHIRPRSVT
jgi:hypothetical protein